MAKQKIYHFDINGITVATSTNLSRILAIVNSPGLPSYSAILKAMKRDQVFDIHHVHIESVGGHHLGTTDRVTIRVVMMHQIDFNQVDLSSVAKVCTGPKKHL